MKLLIFQRFAVLIAAVILSLMFENCGQGFATGDTDAATSALATGTGDELCTISNQQARWSRRR